MTISGPRYDDLNALYINCTLKPSPQLSHTQGLVDVSAAICWSRRDIPSRPAVASRSRTG